jgi:hypothetical protein
MSFNNPQWTGPSEISTRENSNRTSSVRQAKAIGIAPLSEEHEGKTFHVRVFVSRSPLRGQQAFGSITIDTPFGPLTMNGLSIKYNQSKGIITTQTPFKAYPNKRDGGYWNIVRNEFGEVWQTVGAVNYTKFFENDAAGVVSKLFYEAYSLCSTCVNCRDLEPQTVNKMVSRIEELTNKSEKTEEEIKELDKLSNQLSTMNKSCSIDTDEIEWSTSKDANDSVCINCNCFAKQVIDKDKVDMTAASTLFNLSTEVKIDTDETESADTEEEVF